jgi:hypothetical protein
VISSRPSVIERFISLIIYNEMKQEKAKKENKQIVEVHIYIHQNPQVLVSCNHQWQSQCIGACCHTGQCPKKCTLCGTSSYQTNVTGNF